MINNTRTIENALNMMKYLYPELSGKRFKNMDISSIDTLDNLYSLIIATWANSLAREGLYKEYVEVHGDERTDPKGSIDIQETINRQTLLHGSVICNYDEFSSNIFINIVIKSALQYILNSNDIDLDIKTKVKKAILLYIEVDSQDINIIRWKTIKYNNSNLRYKHLIEICKTFIFERKVKKDIGLDDSRRVYLLFKKQLMKYYFTNYSDKNDVSVFRQPYTLEDEPVFESYINKEQQMIAIKNETQALVIMIRLEDELMQKDSTVIRIRLHEFVNYLREYKKENKVKVYGVMMYINIDKTKLNLQPISINNISNYLIGETTVDIHDQWKFIDIKLKDAYTYFMDRDTLKK